METRAFFHGRYLNAVDAKGRVSLPADMRGVIATRAREATATGAYVNDRDLMIAAHREMPCLKGFDVGFLPTLHMQAEEGVAHLTGAERLAASELAHAALFGDIEKTSFDEPGRMVLPPQSRAMAGIEGMALFVGAGTIFHIWNPDDYLACDLIAEFDKRAVRALIATRGGK